MLSTIRRHFKMIPPSISPLLFLLLILFYWFPPSIQFLARRRFLKQARFVLDALHQLSTTPLQIYNVSNSMDCTYKCIEHDQCLSFNMAVNSTGGLKLCQLLPTDKYNTSSNFTPSADFNYHHIDVGLEGLSNPCRNGGTLQLFYWTGNYQCACLQTTSGKHCEWTKLNSIPVHVESKDDKYGTFSAIQSGQILKFKLVHIAGGMTCWHPEPGFEVSKFGCGSSFALYITNQANVIVCPAGPQYAPSWMNYYLPGVTTNDSEVTLPEIDPPLQVTAGQEFRLWYGEDLVTHMNLLDNVGTLDVDVYAFYA